MPKFSGITGEELEALQHFVRKRALESNEPPRP
jgi:hypothetical protein